MVRYNNDQHKESQIFIFEIINLLLNDSRKICLDKLENYISTHKLNEDVRAEIILELLYTDLSILQGSSNFTYFDRIDFNIIKKIPTLLPKFNFLHALKDGVEIHEASIKYLEDIKDSDIYFMAEELPFSIKLSNNKVLINEVLTKYFLSDKINHYLNNAIN
jgi:hypothetical protein